jgi:hypothetical protein
MPFQLRTEADTWFKNISSGAPFKTKFDLYYVCLMLGLASGRNDGISGAPDMVDYFVADYAPVGRLITALLVIAEANRVGIQLTEKASLKKLLDNYLDPTHPAHITKEGFQKLNDYANGGFLILNEALPERPRYPASFLQFYMSLLKKHVKDSDHWSGYVPGMAIV